MSGDTTKQSQEQQVKKLKRFLEGWRVALIPLKSILLWEQQWHPCAIVGAVSILHLAIWLLDMNFLTTIALTGLLISFVDFIIPIISNSLYGPNHWTGQKQKTFEDVCGNIVVYYNIVYDHIVLFFSLRETSPYMFYIISMSMLCALAWLSSSINNIFLLYLVSTMALLWPGVHHRGLLNTVYSMINKVPKVALKSD